jgi:hypothetical protein
MYYQKYGDKEAPVATFVSIVFKRWTKAMIPNRDAAAH